jgi:predicted restriction endonuclease
MKDWLKIHYRGDAHWNWQGGITEKQARDILYPGYKEWRKAVYRRDNWTCRMCGSKKSGILRAHHIEPVKKRPDLILDINNGLTVCKPCHSFIHYGHN